MTVKEAIELIKKELKIENESEVLLMACCFVVLVDRLSEIFEKEMQPGGSIYNEIKKKTKN